MPRTTIGSCCRLTLFFAALISTVPIIWLALPSPLVDTDPTAYATSLLNTPGQTLSRVYSANAFYPYYLTNDHGYMASDLDDSHFTSWNSPYFALYFSLTPSKNDSNHPGLVAPDLRINNASTPCRFTPSQPIYITAPISYGEGIVLPTFATADRVLLQHAIDPHAENATIPFVCRMYRAESNSTTMSPTTTIEILPIKAPQPEDSRPAYPQADEPLLRLTWSPKPGRDLDPMLRAEVPAMPFAGSPSRTFKIRRTMLLSMAPPILRLTDTYGDIICTGIEWIALALYWTLVAGYFAALVFCFLWLFIGRPSLETVLGWCNEKSLARNERVRACCERLEVVRAEHVDERGELAVWWLGRAVLGWEGVRVVLRDGDEVDYDYEDAPKWKGRRGDVELGG